MHRISLVIALGVATPGFLPLLLPSSVALSLLVFAGILLAVIRVFPVLYRSHWWLLPLLVAAFSWGNLYCAQRVESQLSTSLEGQDLWVEGRISTLVEAYPDRLRFQLTLRQASTSAGEPLMDFPQRIQLTWYRPPQWVEALDQGAQLQLQVRLRRPRSFVNPGAFDYHLWQLRHGLGASGYVRAGEGNRLLEPLSYSTRARLRQWLNSFSLSQADLLGALLLGDRSAITQDRWSLLRQTGTSHLVAISGLHIGLVAGFAYLLGMGAGRCLALIWPVRAFIPASLFAALAAITYSALAGFSLPTQRALVMLLVLLLARLAGKQLGGSTTLSAALAAVILLDPLAFYDVGFWLSFGAVATLILVYSGWRAHTKAPLWIRLWRPQWVIFIGLLAPLLLFFNEQPLLSPLANAFAIPVVSLLAVPPLMLATLLGPISETLAFGLLLLANMTLALVFNVLATLAEQLSFLRYTYALSLWSLPLMVLAILGLLLPNPLRFQPLSVLLLLIALWLPSAPPPQLEVTVLDVGQAMAVVIRVNNKTLVYDTGLHFSERFDTGRDIIADYLSRQRVASIDAVVVSHAHADHAGGLPGLLAAIPAKRLLVGEPLKMSQPLSLAQENCHVASPWQWGEATFLFVSAPAQAEGNDASCVLHINFRGQTILLTGDMERNREWRLLKSIEGQGYPVRLLLAPHHGSRHSSSDRFVQQVAAEHVVFSSGYRNRHGHPHAQTLERYEQASSQLYTTAEDGAVQFIWQGQEVTPTISTQRRNAWQFWLKE